MSTEVTAIVFLIRRRDYHQTHLSVQVYDNLMPVLLLNCFLNLFYGQLFALKYNFFSFLFLRLFELFCQVFLPQNQPLGIPCIEKSPHTLINTLLRLLSRFTLIFSSYLASRHPLQLMMILLHMTSQIVFIHKSFASRNSAGGLSEFTNMMFKVICSNAMITFLTVDIFSVFGHSPEKSSF